MKMTLLKVSLFYLLCGSFGCGDFEKNKNTTNALAEQTRINSSQLSDSIKVQVQPTSKPERYMVYFGWPKIEDQKQIRIRKDQVLAQISPNQTTFSHEVDHNQTITYSFDILDSTARVERTFSKLVIIPRDFVVRVGQNTFTENTKLNVSRVFIDSGEALVTNGFTVDIATKELHSTNGIIESFPEKTLANTDKAGRSGGSLAITATTATGTLKIYMRGENGGDGSKGDPYPDRAPGTGAPAGNGTESCECVGSKFCSMNVNHSLITKEEIKPMAVSCTCNYGPSGEQGPKGARGKKGYTAGNGGSSGFLKISIQQSDGFELQTFKLGGNSGAPGGGGDGQPGGEGGKGRSADKHDCRGAQGPSGDPGDIGEPGDPGENGKLDNICVYIASEGKNDCF